MSFENDKLNRGKYAAFLNNLLENNGKYKRDTDSESFTIAIDSAWGTGKTFFLDMWKEELEKDDKNIVIYYNAWKNDFSDNAFESLAYTILNHDIFNSDGEYLYDDKENKKRFKKAGAEIFKIVGKLGIVLSKNVLKNKIGISEEAFDFVEEILGDSGRTVQQLFKANLNKDIPIINHKKYLDNINDLKEVLSNICDEYKITMIIDELDRCKPTFAIEILEIAKHIFDVKGLCFVFALDMSQLSHSIKCVYGEGMDASGYLCRFFDYISKMPPGEYAPYIASLINIRPINIIEFTVKKKNHNGRTNSWNEFTHNYDFVKILTEMAYYYNLSLRDINTIYSNFLIFEKNELQNVTSIHAYFLYMTLLIIKYKYPDDYTNLFTGRDVSILEKDNVMIYDIQNLFITPVLRRINKENQKICDMEHTINIKYESYDQYNKEEIIIIKNIREAINDQIKISATKRINYSKEFIVDGEYDMNVSKLLFYSDIIKWDEIKDKHIGDYIKEKLELYNFEWDQKSNYMFNNQ